MVTRTKTSECDVAALKTESDLALSGIVVRVNREGSRRQQRELQNLTRKYNMLACMYHNYVGIVKSRGFLSGRKSDKGFEKVQNTSCLSLWFSLSQARLEMKELKCYMKACSFRFTEL